MILFERQRDLSVVASFSKCLGQLGLHQAKSSSQKLKLGFPQKWKGLSHLSQHLLPRRVLTPCLHKTRKWKQPGLEPSSNMQASQAET